MSGRVLTLGAFVSAALMLVLAGMIAAGETLSRWSQGGACLMLAALLIAEAIRGLRGAS